MIGDVNLFLSSPDSDDEDTERNMAPTPSASSRRAECEIMIAEPSFRRRGHGKEALELMISYASLPDTLSLPPSAFFSRIGTSNLGSIALFEKLGFSRGKVVEAFEELEMNGPTERGGFRWRDGLSWRLEKVTP